MLLLINRFILINQFIFIFKVLNFLQLHRIQYYSLTTNKAFIHFIKLHLQKFLILIT